MNIHITKHDLAFISQALSNHGISLLQISHRQKIEHRDDLKREAAECFHLATILAAADSIEVTL